MTIRNSIPFTQPFFQPSTSTIPKWQTPLFGTGAPPPPSDSKQYVVLDDLAQGVANAITQYVLADGQPWVIGKIPDTHPQQNTYIVVADPQNRRLYLPNSEVRAAYRQTLKKNPDALASISTDQCRIRRLTNRQLEFEDLSPADAGVEGTYFTPPHKPGLRRLPSQLTAIMPGTRIALTQRFSFIVK